MNGYVEISKQTYDEMMGYMAFDYYVAAYHSGGDDSAIVGTEYKASFPELVVNLPPNILLNNNAFTLKDETIHRRYWDAGSHGILLQNGVAGEDYSGEAYVRITISDHRRDDYLIKSNLDCRHPD